MAVALLIPLRMGDCAEVAKRALISGIMEATQAALDALPARQGTFPPSTAQVL